jgi:hypothetical protein
VTDQSPLVTVLATGDNAKLLVAKMLLEASEIPFVVVGDGLQDLFGIGRLTGGTNFLTGPVQIRVTEEDAEDALEILADMEAGADE